MHNITVYCIRHCREILTSEVNFSGLVGQLILDTKEVSWSWRSCSGAERHFLTGFSMGLSKNPVKKRGQKSGVWRPKSVEIPEFGYFFVTHSHRPL